MAGTGKMNDESSKKSMHSTIPDIRKFAELPVVVIPTKDARSGMQVNYDEYPYSISIIMDSFSSQTAIYGAANQLWLGPKDWGGKGYVDADGTVRIILHPQGDSSISAPSIIYTEMTSCTECALSAANPYFHTTTDLYGRLHNNKPSSKTVTASIIEKLSNDLVCYRQTSKHKLFVIGVAKYSPSDTANSAYFIEAKFTLPVNDSNLATFLAGKFIEMRELN